MDVASSGVDRKSLLAAGVTVLLWASAFVAIRSAGAHFSPGVLALGRMGTAAAELLVIVLLRGEGLPARAAWPGIIGAGVLWFGGYMVALNWAEQHVDAGTAAMVVNIGPVLIALLAGWLLKEGLQSRVLAGIGVSFAGAVVVGLSTSDQSGASLAGVLLCVLAAATYATGVICQKPALRHASALQFTTFGCVVGTVACVPFSWQLVGEVAVAPGSAILNMVYLGVFPTAIAFTTWAYALHRTTAGKMGATTYAVPAVVVLMSWLMLDEIPHWLAFAGGALCLAGVAVTRSRPRRRPGPGAGRSGGESRRAPSATG